MRLNLRTGVITAVGGSGVRVSSCSLELVQSLITISDNSMIVLPKDTDGSFDMLVGVNESLVRSSSGDGSENVTGCIFMTLEQLLFDDDGNFEGREFNNITSCDPAVGTVEQGGNFVPFAPFIVTGNAPVAANVSVDLNRLDSFFIDPDDNEWELKAVVGAQRTTTNSTELRVPEFFLCQTGGEPVSVVDDSGDIFEDVQGPQSNLDELFSLVGNDFTSFVQVSEAAVFNGYRNDDVGENFAFAIRQEDGRLGVGGQNATCSYLQRVGADGVFDLDDGWTLAEVGETCSADVNAVIIAGHNPGPNNDQVLIAVNSDADPDAVNDLLADVGGAVAFIQADSGVDDFNSCALF